MRRVPVYILVLTVFAFATHQGLSQETAQKEEILFESHWDIEGSKGDMVITEADGIISTVIETTHNGEGTTKIEMLISLAKIFKNIVETLQSMEKETQPPQKGE